MMRQQECKPGPLARLIDEIEDALAPYFLLIVSLITIAGFAALWWKIGG